jgi:hypothetical protein
MLEVARGNSEGKQNAEPGRTLRNAAKAKSKGELGGFPSISGWVRGFW